MAWWWRNMKTLLMMALVVACLLVCDEVQGARPLEIKPEVDEAVLSSSSSSKGKVVPNVGVVLPTAIVDGVLHEVEPLLADLLSSIPLPTCCYDLLGQHLDFQNLTIGHGDIDLSLTSTKDMLHLDGDIFLPIEGFYHFCHTGIFSKGCSTYGSCKGNFSLGVNVSTGFDVAISVKKGQLDVNVTVAQFELLHVKDDFCPVFHDLVNSTTLQKALVAVVDGLLHDVAEDLSSTLTQALNGGFNTTAAQVSWTYSDLTQNTDQSAIVLMNVAVANASGALGPAKQRAAPPLKPLKDDNIHMIIGDSVLTNTLVVLAQTGALDINTVVDVGNATAAINVSVLPTPVPTVGFNTTKETILLRSKLKMHVPWTPNDHLHALLDLALKFQLTVEEVKVNDTKQFQFNIHIKELAIPHIRKCSGPCELLVLLQQFLKSSGVSIINKQLQKNPIRIPKGILSILDLEFGDSFLDVKAGLDSAADIRRAVVQSIQRTRHLRLLQQSVKGDSGIACPIKTSAKCVDP